MNSSVVATRMYEYMKIENTDKEKMDTVVLFSHNDFKKAFLNVFFFGGGVFLVGGSNFRNTTELLTKRSP